MYTQKLLVRFKFFMVKNMGIKPALKYMVIIIKRYQNFLFHIFCCVNIKPKNAEANTVQAVPITVLPTETHKAVPSPLILITLI